MCLMTISTKLQFEFMWLYQFWAEPDWKWVQTPWLNVKLVECKQVAATGRCVGTSCGQGKKCKELCRVKLFFEVCMFSEPPRLSGQTSLNNVESALWNSTIEIVLWLGLLPCMCRVAGCWKVAFTKVSSSHIVGRCQKCYFPPFSVPFGSARGRRTHTNTPFTKVHVPSSERLLTNCNC